MKELKKLSLKEELDREAEIIEKEVGKRHDLDDLTVSEEAETALFNKIQDYEYDKRFKKTVHRSRKKRRILLAVAAVLVLICGSVITGTGSKSYLKVLMERIVGGEQSTIINVEDMDSQKTEDLDEIQLFYEIREKTGISPVHFGYIPKKMHLKKYEINREQGSAVLLYDYNGHTIQYSMYMNDEDSSLGQIATDKLIKKYEVQSIEGITAQVKIYEIDGQTQNRYIGEFEYQDAQYQIIGVMQKEDFEEMIKNLYFIVINA